MGIFSFLPFYFCVKNIKPYFINNYTRENYKAILSISSRTYKLLLQIGIVKNKFLWIINCSKFLLEE